MPRPDPAVLIHGAWQGSWVWDKFLPLLSAAGIEAVAADLPGNGTDRTPPDQVSLQLYVDHVARILAKLGRPATLIAHSGGGLTASAVAEAMPDQVARLVYIAGMMLPDGSSFGDIVSSMLPGRPEAAGVAPHLEWSSDGLTSRVPPEAAWFYFLHDIPKAEALAAAARLTPQPEGGRAIVSHMTPERFGRVPRLYVEATLDRSVVLACQRRMQVLVPGADVVTLATGHAPHVSAPQLLANALLPFLLAPAPSRAKTI